MTSFEAIGLLFINILSYSSLFPSYYLISLIFDFDIFFYWLFRAPVIKLQVLLRCVAS